MIYFYLAAVARILCQDLLAGEFTSEGASWVHFRFPAPFLASYWNQNFRLVLRNLPSPEEHKNHTPMSAMCALIPLRRVSICL
ncbi:5, 10-methenyltetrahydrofolate synthetase, isoform CRA_b [Mus musculus]|nr:5, 10-methenyltetrahydrofolate synthetase, isoform CRA_b [Mus musculus]